MEELKLNRKLAEWAGFICYWEEGATDGLWHYPDEPRKQMRKDIPDFTQSLDACFKWLVPKARKLGVKSIELRQDCCILGFGYGDKMIFTEGETPALALCLAIEKLIDAEEK